MPIMTAQCTAKQNCTSMFYTHLLGESAVNSITGSMCNTQAMSDIFPQRNCIVILLKMYFVKLKLLWLSSSALSTENYHNRSLGSQSHGATTALTELSVGMFVTRTGKNSLRHSHGCVLRRGQNTVVEVESGKCEVYREKYSL